MEESASWSRRDFLKGSLALGAVMSAPGWARAGTNERVYKLTVLHTNDWHSRIDPFPANDNKYPGQGGAARRSALIQQIRREGSEVLLLDAGDIFQGTPYFNFYGGEPEYRLMSAMGYEAATFGNHDFDNGVEGLLRMMPYSTFPFVNCNYRIENAELKKRTQPSVVIKKGKLRIGVLGVGVELDGLVHPANHKGVYYTDPVLAANNEAARLRNEEKCHLVICLSHLGLKYDTNKVSDMVLATSSENIDLIIGGHTHTFLDEPIILRNKVGKTVAVNQAGWAGLRLGRIDYVFSSQNNVENEHFSMIEDFKKSIAI